MAGPRKEDYQWQAKGQFHGDPLRGRLEIDVTLYFDRKGRKDWDNFHELSMDALSGIVWEDDDQIDAAHVPKRYDKENPRIELTIESLELRVARGLQLTCAGRQSTLPL